MNSENREVFYDVLPKFVSETRSSYSAMSLYPLMEDFRIHKGQVEIEEKHSEVCWERYRTLVERLGLHSFSCLSREVKKATAYTHDDSYHKLSCWDVDTRDLSDKFQPNQALRGYRKSEKEVYLVVDRDDFTETSDEQMTECLVFLLSQFIDLSTRRLCSIEKVHFPHYLLGRFLCHLLKVDENTVTITVYASTTVICGQLLNVKFDQTSQQIGDLEANGICVGDRDTQDGISSIAECEKEGVDQIQKNGSDLTDLINPVNARGEEKSEDGREAPDDNELEVHDMILATLDKIGFNVDKLKPNQTFIHIGLDSLRIAELEYHLQLQYPESKIPYGVALRENTVEKLACYIEEQLSTNISKDDFSSTGTPTAPAYNSIPLSSTQKRIAFMCQLEPESQTQFNEFLCFKLKRFDKRKFSRTLLRLLMRHMLLRTVYTTSCQLVISGTECYITPRPVVNCVNLASTVINIFEEIPLKIFYDSFQRILFVLHHIAFDGTSIRLFTNEFLEEYRNPHMNSHTVPRSQYIHYAWNSQDYNFMKSLEYWKDHLKGLQDHQLSRESAHKRGAPKCRIKIIDVPRRLMENLEAYCRTRSWTEFSVLISLFNILISKLHNFEEFAVGTPIANRRSRETQRMLGCFVNTLVFRVKSLRNETLEENVKNGVKILAEALAHSDAPFEKIVHVLARSNEDDPLFRIMFVSDRIEKPGDVEVVEVAPEVPKYEQIWYWRVDDSKNHTVEVEYDSSVYSEKIIDVYMSSYLRLLSIFLKTPSKELEKTDFSSKQQSIRRQISNVDYPRSKNFLGVVREQVTLLPNSTIADSIHSLTYPDLDVKADTISRRLIQTFWIIYGYSAFRDTIVGVYLEQSILRILVMYATWKAGMVPLPMNMDWPIAKQKATLDHYADHLVITSNPQSWTGQALSSRDLWERTETRICTFLNSDMDDVMYITCTSGSTGEPKSVVTEFVGHNNLSMAYTGRYFLSHHSSVYQVVNYAFDIFFADLTMSMGNGCDMKVSSDPMPDPSEMQSISHSYIMPAYLSALDNHSLLQLAHLECILFGGEPIQEKVRSALIEMGVCMHQQYGTTEQCVYSSSVMMKTNISGSTLGFAYENLRIGATEEDGTLHTSVLPNEVTLQGIGISRGYYGLEESSISYEISDLNREDLRMGVSRRVFRTKDLLLKRGLYWTFHGRADSQIKIRGKIINPNDVRTDISSHPHVHACVVVPLKEDENGGIDLVAYVQFDDGGKNNNVEELIGFLGGICPEYSIPRYIISVEAFPLNANGKIDTRKLPRPHIEVALTQNGSFITAPVSENDRIICEVFEKVLKVQPIHMESCFFSSGGDSIRAMYVTQEINSRLSVHLKLKEFMRLKTPIAISRYLYGDVDKDSSTPEDPLIKASPGTTPPPIPLTPPQKRLWFLEKLRDRGDEYLIKLRIILEGSLNRSALEYTVNAVIAQHSSLRSSISSEEPLQIPLSLTERFYYLHDDPREYSILQDTVAISFVKQKATVHALQLLLHHIIVDGGSLAILCQTLSNSFNVYLTGNLVAPSRRRPYLEAAKANSRKEEASFWKQYLEGYEKIDIQSPYKILSLASSDKAETTRSIATVLNFVREDEVLKWTEADGHSLFYLLCSSLFATFQTASLQDDIILGTTVSSRTLETMDNVGMFVNMIPLRCRVAHTSSSFTDHCVAQISDSLDHQMTDFEEILTYVNVERNSEEHPLFQHVINYQNLSSNQAPKIKGLITSVEYSEPSQSEFDTSWTFSHDFCGKLQLNLIYKRSKYGEDHVRHLLRTFKKFFTRLSSNRPINTVINSPNEQTEVDIPFSMTLGPAVTMQQNLLPHAVYLKLNDESMSYVDCVLKAKWMARRLHQEIINTRGIFVRPDDSIAFNLQEGLDNYLLILTCQLLGVAFLSIHPSNPTERVCRILDSSSVIFFVSNENFDSVSLTVKNLHFLVELEKIVQIHNPTDPIDAAYLIYTSGSTGSPKGVVVPGRAVWNMVSNWTQLNHFHVNQRVYMFTKCSFDGGFGNVLGAPVNGGTILIRNEERPFSEDLQTYGQLDVVHCTPTILSYLEVEQQCRIGKLNVGGEKFLANSAQDVDIFQLYGPAEATCYQTSLRMKPNHCYDNIGETIPNMSHTIVNKDSKHAPFLTAELQLSGRSLARGYTDDLLTAESFKRRPSGNLYSNRHLTYSTGDLVWEDSRGGLHFSRRIDDQCKLNGVRIELGDVEATFLSHSDVHQAVVKIIECCGTDNLVLFYSGKPKEEEYFERIALEHLPDFMIPHAFVLVEEFSMTTNGKIDREKLTLSSCSSQTVATLDEELHEKVLKLFKHVLKNEGIRENDNFFAVGGNSLLSVELAHKLSATLGMKVSIRDIFKHPSTSKLTLYLMSRAADKYSEVDQVEAEEKICTSDLDRESAEERFLLKVPAHLAALAKALIQSADESFRSSYLCQTSLRLRNHTRETVTLWLRMIMQKYSTLRSIFLYQNKTIIQYLLSGTESYFLPHREHTKAHPPCDNLMIGVRFPSEDQILIIMSHLITDGHSAVMIADEFEKLSKREFQATFTNPREFYKFLNAQRAGNLGEWKHTLQKFNLNPLKTDHPRTRGTLMNTSVYKKIFCGNQKILRNLSQKTQVSEFALLLYLMSNAIQKRSVHPRKPTTIGFPVNLRSGEYQDFVGYGIDTSFVIANPTARNDVEDVVEQLNDSLPTSRVPYQQLLEMSGMNRLFDVMLTYDSYTKFENDNFELLPEDTVVSKYPISVFISDKNDDLVVEVHYFDNLFTVETIISLVDEIMEFNMDSESSTTSFRADNVILNRRAYFDLDDVNKILNSHQIHNCAIHKVASESYQLAIPPSINRSDVERILRKCLPIHLQPKEILIKEENETKPHLCRQYSDGFPLSWQQEQMYHLSQNDSNNFYLNPYVNRFRKPFDLRHVRMATLFIIQNQESFRTRFIRRTSQISQEILSMTESYFDVHIEKASDSNLEELMRLKHQKKYNLLKDGVLKAHILDAETFVVVLLLVHHIIIDASSTFLWTRLTQKFVRILERGQLPTIRRRPFNYIHYSLGQKNQNAGVDTSILDRLVDAIDTRQLLSMDKIVESETLHELTVQEVSRISAAFKTSPFVIFAVLLFRSVIKLIGIKSLLFGIVTSNRRREEKDLIGYFLNYLVLPITSDAPVFEQIAVVKEEWAQINKLNIPLPTLKSELQKRTPLADHLYDVFFNLRYDLESSDNITMSGLDRELVDINEHPVAPVDLLIDVEQGTYKISVRSSSKRVDSQQLTTELIKQFHELENAIGRSKRKEMKIFPVGRQEITENICVNEVAVIRETQIALAKISPLLHKAMQHLDCTFEELWIVAIYRMLPTFSISEDSSICVTSDRHSFHLQVEMHEKEKELNDWLSELISTIRKVERNQQLPTRNFILLNFSSKSSTIKTSLQIHFSKSQPDLVTCLFDSDLHRKSTVVKFIHKTASFISHVLRKQAPIIFTTKQVDDRSFNERDASSVDIPTSTLSSLIASVGYKNQDICIQTLNSQLSYKDIYQRLSSQSDGVKRSNWLTNGRSLRPDDCVAVIGAKCLESTLACLGCVLAGVAYVPIDVLTPQQRMDQILQNSGVSLYLSDSKMHNLKFAKHFKIDYINGLSKRQWNSNVPEDACYAIHTSGTTGIPKAVVCKHESVVNMAVAATESFKMSNSDVVYQFTNFVYDNSVLEIFMGLFNGARLFVDSQNLTPSRFAALVVSYNISYALLFPGLVELFDNLKSLSRLRYWVVGAEKLSGDLFQRAIENDINVIQNYGPTETTCFALCRHMRNQDHPNNLGKTIRNMSVSIGNQEMIEFCENELIIHGKGRMRGYICSEYSDLPYATGDVGYRLPDGNVIFKGRNDDQIKINGHRVELSEIEIALMDVKGVDKARVFYKKETRQLYAFYTGKPLYTEKLREHCSHRLLPHFIPHRFQHIDEFPLTTNCKIDKENLWRLCSTTRNGFCPEMSPDVPEFPKTTREISSESEVETRKKTFAHDNMEDEGQNATDHEFEAELLQILREIFKSEQIELEDDFYYVGGNSLNAPVLCERIQEKWGIDVDVQYLFQTPEFQNLSDRLQEKIRSQQRITVIEVPSDSSEASPSTHHNFEHSIEFERGLKGIWEELGLNTTNLNHRSHFAICGGCSLKLINLHVKIYAKFKVDVSVADLIRHQRFGQMISLITRISEKTCENVVSILRENSKNKITLLFFHPLVGGGFYPYKHLINELYDLPIDIVTVEHPNTFAETHHDDDIDSMPALVRFYRKRLGPVLSDRRCLVVIGSSLGGRLGYEFAYQTRNVRQVINIDGSGRRVPRISLHEHNRQMKEVISNYIDSSDEVSVNNLISNSWNLLRMVDDNEPRSCCDLQMELISIGGETLGWTDVTNINVHSIEGDHQTLLTKDKVTVVADVVRQIIKDL